MKHADFGVSDTANLPANTLVQALRLAREDI